MENTEKIIVVGHDITDDFKTKVIAHLHQEYGDHVSIVFVESDELKHKRLEKEKPIQLNELALIPYKIQPIITPFIDFEQSKRKRINERPNYAFTHKYRKK